jgi:putative spermidine/putrescine transport system ATP-binding protein
VGDQVFRSAGIPDGVRDGQDVTIALRPELLSLNSADAQTNSLLAYIENITFLGSIVRYTLTLGGRTLFADTFNNPHLQLPRIADEVRVSFAPDSVLVIKQAI